MPVNVIFTGVSSNKQGEEVKKGSIEAESICYVPIKGRVAVLKPFIDKISITYKIYDPDLRGAILEALLMKAEAGGNYSSSKTFKAGKVQYKASVQLSMPHNGAQALIQAIPKNKGLTHHLRLEFNPRALGAEGIGFLKSEIEDLQLEGLNFDHIIQTGKVTGVDIAVDIVGIRINDLDIRYLDGGKSHWYFSELGNAETGYFGIKVTADKKNTNAPAKAYNKRKELKDKASTPMPQLYGGLSHTRIEYHAKANKPLALLAKTLKNPFSSFSIAYPTPPQGVKSHHWRFFLDSIQRRGFDAALALVPDGPGKLRHQTAVEAAHTTFWKPEAIWVEWPDAINASGLVLQQALVSVESE